MTAELRRHLHAVPFEPFVIVMSSGQRYAVPTADHAGTNPEGTRVVVWFDDGGSVTIASLHITAIEKEPKSRAA